MKKFNPNWIGGVLLICAFAFSVFRYRSMMDQIGDYDPTEGAERVVRVLHWQLEPGYREGLQDAIDEYNQLPHVQEAGVKVIQLAIPERVYSQFLNVHLISGTAPDICVKGMSELVGDSSSTARFFDPISEHVEVPNPYNRGEYLQDDLSEPLSTFLSERAWSETFSDGMTSGWDEANQDFYAVPISSWGSVRVFYNQTLVEEIKEYMRESWKADPPPAWKTTALDELDLIESADSVEEWLSGPEPPRSLGLFLMFCEATLAYAQENQLENLVPISASNYSSGQFVPAYRFPFTYGIASRLNVDHNQGISPQEIFGGWQAGLWEYDNPGFQAFFEIAQLFPRFFPAGFLGLDREQAHRRFVLGNAVFLATGAWDANSIFLGAADKSNPEDVFEVGIMPYPMPVPGERWFEAYHGKPSGTGSRLGVPMAINKTSQNKEWAVDFLQFVTSHRVNERFNRIAGWIPGIVGTEPQERMKPFQPNPTGLPRGIHMHMRGGGQLTTLLRGQFLLYFSDEISFEEFKVAVKDILQNPRYGADRVWYDQSISSRDRARQYDRSFDIRLLEEEAFGDSSMGRAVNLFDGSLRSRDGKSIRLDHQQLLPDTPFPEF